MDASTVAEVLSAAGYQLLDRIESGSPGGRYRGRRAGDSLPVTIELFDVEGASYSDKARFRRGYEAIKGFEIDGIVAVHDVVECAGGVALVREPFEALPLSQLLQEGPLEAGRFLELAVALVETVAELHKRAVLHGDIRPANILVSPATGKAKLTGFAIDRLLTHQTERLHDPEVVERVLPYLSPEQTGRINRPVDYRTDMYSLGVSFFEMLSGRPPFVSSDPMQLIHAHIAREPEPLHRVAPAVSRPLSAIAARLLAKSAEDRYQSAYGLLYDLRQCDELRSSGDPETVFTAGSRDFALKLNVPQVLIGREPEQQCLLNALIRVVGTGVPEMVLVSGHPGVGKSSLINEIQKPVVAENGYFAAGKFDRFKRDVPYSAILQALSALVEQILVQSPESRQAWARQLRQALRGNGRIITDAIPAVRHLIGEQPELPALGPEEAENRFRYAFRGFIRVLAAPTHPLVLFLDDLQWANQASLLFIRNVLAHPDSGTLLLIGAFRQNEVQGAHPLNEAVAAMQKRDVRVESIRVDPLCREDVRQYLATFLNLEPREVEPLVDTVAAKTDGNPFFINQFVRALHDREIVTRDESGRWIWDMEKVRSPRVTDNVIELMLEKIAGFSLRAQEALKMAACIGHGFDLRTLCSLMQTSPEQVLDDLSQVLEAGLLTLNGDRFSFLHDRIHEAAYTLVSEPERGRRHRAIGRFYYEETAPGDLETRVFDVVNQLNLAGEEMAAGADRDELASLNLVAGKTAKASAAHQSAFAYYRAGVELLRGDCWQQQADLARDLHVGAAEAAYLNGDLPAMERYLETVLANTSGVLERVPVFEIRMLALNAQNRLRDAADTAFEILPLLGVEIPASITGELLMEEFAQTSQALAGKSDADILAIPRMTDPSALAAIQVATAAATSLYSGGYTGEIILIVNRMVRLSLEKGIAPQTPFWFSCYAMVLFSLDQLDTAFRFADFALELKRALPMQREIRTENIVHSFFTHWRQPMKKAAVRLKENYQLGMELGDLECAHSSVALHCFIQYIAGTPLDELEREAGIYTRSMKQHNMNTYLNYNLIKSQAVANLRARSESFVDLEGGHFSARRQTADLESGNDQISLFLLYFFSMKLSYLWGELDAALQNAEKAKRYLSAVSGGMPHIAQFYFYRSLVRLAAMRGDGMDQRARGLEKIAYAQGKLRAWAVYSPENLQNKIDLVEAECCRVKGELLQAEALYEKAIEGARRNGLLHELALAFELAAGFYQERGLGTIAAAYLTRAVECYSSWGAHAKVERMKQTHPRLFAGLGGEAGAVGKKGSVTLDLQTVIKASQAISGEIVLESLLRRLIQIGIENAGAQRGAILVEKGDKLFVAAVHDLEGKVELVPNTPVEAYPGFPLSVLNYVHMTGKNVILDNACEDERFGNDPHIRTNGVKSLLCGPLRHHKKRVAIFFAENNLTAGAFTQQRLELLTVLSSQAAISLENARLFKEVKDAEQQLKAHRDHLEEMIEERAKELKAAQEELVRNAHQAGMADIAVSVLHNVGNVLNSLNVSIHTLRQMTKGSRSFEGMKKANGVIRDNLHNLEDFILQDPRGRKLLQYCLDIGELQDRERKATEFELQSLLEKSDLITNIINAQQSYVSSRSLMEPMDITTVIDGALTLQEGSIRNQGIAVTRDYRPVPEVMVEKTKLFHVLINVLSNAKNAMRQTPPAQRSITVSTRRDNGSVFVTVSDSGEGIEKRNLERIFSQGFTTRADGHGFGLHSSANYMTEMGGRMWAESAGSGAGATIVLQLPCNASEG